MRAWLTPISSLLRLRSAANSSRLVDRPVKDLSLLIPTPDGEMPVFAAVPQDVACAPGVLVYMDVFGPREGLRDIARRFASCVYLAVLPHLFHRLGSPVFAPTNRADDVLAEAVVRANDATSLQGSAMDTARTATSVSRSATAADESLSDMMTNHHPRPVACCRNPAADQPIWDQP